MSHKDGSCQTLETVSKYVTVMQRKLWTLFPDTENGYIEEHPRRLANLDIYSLESNDNV